MLGISVEVGYSSSAVIRPGPKVRKMIEIMATPMRLRRSLLTLFVLLLLPGFLAAQDDTETKKADKPEFLVTGFASVESIHGGEKFSYTFTVKNLTGETATNVRFDHDLESLISFVSASVSQGKFHVNDGFPPDLWCEFGDLQGYASATLTIEVKVRDWGDTSQPESPYMADLEKLLGKMGNLPRDSDSEGEGQKDQQPPARKFSKGATLYQIYLPHVRCDNCDQTQPARGSTLLMIEVLPSKNIPPRVELITPKENQAIVRSVDRPGEVVLNIKAYDPDGSVVKVMVQDPQFFAPNDMFVDAGIRKIKIQGKVYTLEELAENPEPYKYYERLAVKTGKDTYTYTLRNLRFGFISLAVTAIDNGGRYSTGLGPLLIRVVGDAKIGFRSLIDKQIVRPADLIRLETVSTINDPKLNDLRIDIAPIGPGYTSFASMPRLRKVSAAGNVFRHEYLWENPKEGVYNVHLYLLSGEYPTNEQAMQVIVAEERNIKITSIKNGQEFSRNERVKISVDAFDIKGKNVNDELPLLIDGKYNGSVHGRDTSIIEYLSPGLHTIQVVAKLNQWGYDSIELGRSEIITIRIK